MLYRALKSFSGVISMKKGEVKDIAEKLLVGDLLRSKYIEEVKSDKVAKKVK